MRTSSASARRIARLVVDANPILSALIRGRARDIFLSPAIAEFATTVKTLHEVLEYIPLLARRAKRMRGIEADLYAALAAMPLRVYEPDFYQGQRAEAKRRIAHRDPDDVDVLALALKLNCPLWSNDADFEETGVELYTTAQLLRKLRL